MCGGGGGECSWVAGRFEGRTRGGMGGGAKSSLDRHGKGEGQLNSRKGRGGGGGGGTVCMLLVCRVVAVCPCVHACILQRCSCTCIHSCVEFYDFCPKNQLYFERLAL